MVSVISLVKSRKVVTPREVVSTEEKLMPAFPPRVAQKNVLLLDTAELGMVRALRGLSVFLSEVVLVRRSANMTSRTGRISWVTREPQNLIVL